MKQKQDKDLLVIICLLLIELNSNSAELYQICFPKSESEEHCPVVLTIAENLSRSRLNYNFCRKVILLLTLIFMKFSFLWRRRKLRMVGGKKEANSLGIISSSFSFHLISVVKWRRFFIPFGSWERSPDKWETTTKRVMSTTNVIKRGKFGEYRVHTRS